MAQGFVDTRHGCIHYVQEGSGIPMIDDPALFVTEVDRLIRQVSR
jgi:hypothetical protein